MEVRIAEFLIFGWFFEKVCDYWFIRFSCFYAISILLHSDRSVHSGHRVDFGSGVSNRFKIGSCVHIGFHIILNSFWNGVKDELCYKVGWLLGSWVCFKHLYIQIIMMFVKLYHHRPQQDFQLQNGWFMYPSGFNFCFKDNRSSYKFLIDVPHASNLVASICVIWSVVFCFFQDKICSHEKQILR